MLADILVLLYFAVILIALIDLVFKIWGAVSTLTSSKSTTTKILWILVIALVPFGGLIWFFIDYR